MSAAPFLKWVGGKTALLPRLQPLLPAPEEVSGYREPFLGGGAVFFRVFAGVRPARLSDRNADLIAAYLAVRDHVDELGARLLEELPRFSEERFYAVRERLNRHRAGVAPLPLLERAVSVFLINRWGFNGLWRENAKGEVTTSYGWPSGDAGLRGLDPEGLRACARALEGVDLAVRDFAEQLTDLRPRELVYLDPPYAPTGPDVFTGYTAEGFSYRPRQVALFPDAVAVTDQERLEGVLERVDAAGAWWFLSNQPSPALEELQARWTAHQLSARRSVSADPSTRGAAAELVITNCPNSERAGPAPGEVPAGLEAGEPRPGESPPAPGRGSGPLMQRGRRARPRGGDLGA